MKFIVLFQSDTIVVTQDIEYLKCGVIPLDVCSKSPALSGTYENVTGIEDSVGDWIPP